MTIDLLAVDRSARGYKDFVIDINTYYGMCFDKVLSGEMNEA